MVTGTTITAKIKRTRHECPTVKKTAGNNNDHPGTVAEGTVEKSSHYHHTKIRTPSFFYERKNYYVEVGQHIVTVYKPCTDEFNNSAMNEARMPPVVAAKGGGADVTEEEVIVVEDTTTSTSLSEAEAKIAERTGWEAVLRVGDRVGDLKKRGIDRESEPYKAAVAALHEKKEWFKATFGKAWKPSKEMKKAMKASDDKVKAFNEKGKKRAAVDVVGSTAWAAKQRREGKKRESMRVWKEGENGEPAPISLGEWRAANSQLGKAVMRRVLAHWEAAKGDEDAFHEATKAMAGCLMKRWVGHTIGMSEEEKKKQREKPDFERMGHVMMWFKDRESMALMREAVEEVLGKGAEGQPFGLKAVKQVEDARATWVAILEEEEWNGLGDGEAARRLALLMLLRTTTTGWTMAGTSVEKAYEGKAKKKIVVVLKTGKDLEGVLDRAEMPLSTPLFPLMMWKKENGWQDLVKGEANGTEEAEKSMAGVKLTAEAEEEFEEAQTSWDAGSGGVEEMQE